MNTAERVTLKIGNTDISMPANDVIAFIMRDADKHPDDQAVDAFAAAMRAKMKHAREVKGLHGWNDPTLCSTAYLNSRLCEQINKGDAVDLANFAMMMHARGEPITPSRSLIADHGTPKLGHFWQGQGGFYAGIIQGDDKKDYHLIVSPEDLGGMKDVQWGCAGNEVAGATSNCDGMPNTQAMATNGSELAKQILALEIDGHKDWYLPARKEARLCHINTEHQFESDWYWTSTQSSAYHAFFQHFEVGNQTSLHKVTRSRARAVRRFSVIQ